MVTVFVEVISSGSLAFWTLESFGRVLTEVVVVVVVVTVAVSLSVAVMKRIVNCISLVKCKVFRVLP